MNATRSVVIVILGTVLAACAAGAHDHQTRESIRPALDLPGHFMVGTEAGMVEPTDDGRCHSPMIDPRDGTRLIMVRSSGGMGDYSVDDGRYGVDSDELLRIECASGVAVGIVRR